MSKSKQKPELYKSMHNGILVVDSEEFTPGVAREVSAELLEKAQAKHAIKIGLLVKA